MYNTNLYVAMIHLLRVNYLGFEMYQRLYPVQIGLNAHAIEI